MPYPSSRNRNAAAAHPARLNFEATRRKVRRSAMRKNLPRARQLRTYRLTPMRTPLRRTKFAQRNSSTSSASFASSTSFSCSIPFTSFRLRALELSCRSFSGSCPLFSITCALFYKNTGGGIPFASLATRRSSLATSSNSFPCHTSDKFARNPSICHTSKSKRLKVLCLPHIRKTGGVGVILLTSAAHSARKLRQAVFTVQIARGVPPTRAIIPRSVEIEEATCG
jgi:hypothetical protein